MPDDDTVPYRRVLIEYADGRRDVIAVAPPDAKLVVQEATRHDWRDVAKVEPSGPSTRVTRQGVRAALQVLALYGEEVP